MTQKAKSRRPTPKTLANAEEKLRVVEKTGGNRKAVENAEEEELET